MGNVGIFVLGQNYLRGVECLLQTFLGESQRLDKLEKLLAGNLTCACGMGSEHDHSSLNRNRIQRWKTELDQSQSGLEQDQVSVE